MTREQFRRLTQRHRLGWITPPERKGQVVTQYAETEGRYWKALDDRNLPDDHPDAVEVYRADANDPRDVPDGTDWAPWYREPNGITWHRVAEA